jgi:hypothetical protein
MKIKSGHVVIDVIENKELLDDGCCGQLRYNRDEIHIMPGLSPGMQRTTIWHEIIHMALYQLGMREHSEETIDGLTHRILDVIINNPHLIVWTCNPDMDMDDDPFVRADETI